MSPNKVIAFCLLAMSVSTGLNTVFAIPLCPAMLVTALASIVIGSMLSVKLSPLLQDEEEGESVGTKEALRFPLMASGGLLSLYLLILYAGKDWVNSVLSVYFAFLGTCCVKIYIRPVLDSWIKQPRWKYRRTFSPSWMTRQLILSFDMGDILGYVLASGIGLAYFYTKYWLLNNVLGVAFAVYGIEKISLNSFKAGAILLLGLFFYDVFWVFGTDVMLTVARNVDLPIKLLFPKGFGVVEDDEFALLGLGDVIIPGVVLALAYRFDYFLSCKKERKGLPHYFLAGLISYALGLISAVIVMRLSETGQPALLYLVPTVLVSIYATGSLRKELRELNSYRED